MVGPLMFMKILHCKRNQKSRNHEERSREDDLHTIKTEKREEADRICRVCLKEGDVPIFGNHIYENVSDDLNDIADIDVRIDDELPQYLCDSCSTSLQSAIHFRKTAQQSNQILRRPAKKEQEPTNEALPEFPSDNDDNNHVDDEDYYKVKDKSTLKFHCKRCDLDFDTFSLLAEHRLTQEHENIRRTCHICNKSYSAMYFRRHLASHKLKTKHMCDICSKTFNVQGQLSRHRLTHFYDLPFKCPLCPYRGRFTESLKMHMKTHTGEKPYQCSQCAARFVNKSNLNKHTLTHRTDHDFNCDTCGRGFYSKRELDQHFKVDHMGIKDHVCGTCGKAFGYRKQMMKHQLKVHKRPKLRSGRVPLYLKVEERMLRRDHDYD